MKYIGLILLPLLLTSCLDDQGARSQIAELETRISSLEAELSAIREASNQVASNLLKFQVEMASKNEAEFPAIVDSASKEYAIATNRFGAFPVGIENAETYLDGHKVKFRVGNLTSASLTNVKLEIVFGERNPDPPKELDELSDRGKSKGWSEWGTKMRHNLENRRTLTVDAGKDLAPGSWNMAEAIISPSKPEDLGRIEVRVIVMGMKLSNPR
jgi:hypothetical protein